MIMNIRKTHLAIAVAGSVGLLASTAQAVEFNASTTLQNTLSVSVVNDFDIGTVFATSTGTALNNGVGAVVIDADGGAAEFGLDSTTVNLTSLTAPTPAQGSVEMAGDFTVSLPDTSSILTSSFPVDAGTTLAKITAPTATAQTTELVHESANPAVPSLYLMHFTLGDVSGGESKLNDITPVVVNDGRYIITQDFGETTYVFNIGATLTTEPFVSGATPPVAATYQAGLYSGTFEVTAAY